LIASARTTLNAYTIHAEVEGILMANDFRQLLAQAGQRATFSSNPCAPAAGRSRQPARRALSRGVLEGREGWLGVQQP
jgi:undecaprenyl phosphate-alpha-L-ara4FN deformylase